MIFDQSYFWIRRFKDLIFNRDKICLHEFFSAELIYPFVSTKNLGNRANRSSAYHPPVSWITEPIIRKISSILIFFMTDLKLWIFMVLLLLLLLRLYLHTKAVGSVLADLLVQGGVNVNLVGMLKRRVRVGEVVQ